MQWQKAWPLEPLKSLRIGLLTVLLQVTYHCRAFLLTHK